MMKMALDLGLSSLMTLQHLLVIKEAALLVIKWAFENTDYKYLYSYMNKQNIHLLNTALSAEMKKVKEYTDEFGEELIVCPICKK